MKPRLIPRIGYPALLFSLVLLLLVPPHFEMLGIGIESTMPFRLLFALLMLSALAPIAQRHRTLAVGVVLAIPVVVTDWVALGESRLLWRLLAYFSFVSFVTINLFAALLRARKANLETICAALCFYLLAVLNWALLYAMLESMAPGSFNLPAGAAGQGLLLDMIYFSFVTIASLGYGDILPLSDAARVWAASEVVFGQFFIAIVLARLVAMQMMPQKEN